MKIINVLMVGLMFLAGTVYFMQDTKASLPLDHLVIVSKNAQL